MKRLVLFISVIGCFSVFGQQEEFQPRGSFKAEIALANNVSNVAFRDLMQGLANVTSGYQYTFPSSLSLGAGVRWNYFAVNQFKNNVDLAGGIHFAGVYGKIGVERYYGQVGIDVGIRGGYNMMFATTNKCKESGGAGIYDGGFIEPILNIGLLADENQSFYLTTSFAFQTFKFQPFHVCEPTFAAYPAEKLDRITTYFTIGFGYSFYFGKIK
jgi:hypothetical protein